MKSLGSLLITLFRTPMFRTPMPLLVISFILGSGYVYRHYIDRIAEVKTVSLEGDLRPAQKQEVYTLLASMDLVDVRLDAVKIELESLAWIKGIEVQRQWPDKLVLNVQPQVAVALWNRAEFINAEGFIFESKYQSLNRLPQLYGPQGTEKTVVDRYREISSLLMSENSFIHSLRLDDRGAWVMTRQDGVVVLLGKDDITERLQNMLLVVARVKNTPGSAAIRKIDTRYANGVAIAWHETMASVQTYKKQREEKL